MLLLIVHGDLKTEYGASMPSTRAQVKVMAFDYIENILPTRSGSQRLATITCGI